MQPDRIVYIREVFDLTQRELARALSVTPATVSRWETGAFKPVGLHGEILQALRTAACVLAEDDPRSRRISGLLQLGVGSMLVHTIRLEEDVQQLKIELAVRDKALTHARGMLVAAGKLVRAAVGWQKSVASKLKHARGSRAEIDLEKALREATEHDYLGER